jgi:hypothetical protein
MRGVMNERKHGGEGCSGDDRFCPRCGRDLLQIDLRGPVFGREQVRKLIEQIDAAVSDGAKLVVTNAPSPSGLPRKALFGRIGDKLDVILDRVSRFRFRGRKLMVDRLGD